MINKIADRWEVARFIHKISLTKSHIDFGDIMFIISKLKESEIYELKELDKPRYRVIIRGSSGFRLDTNNYLVCEDASYEEKEPPELPDIPDFDGMYEPTSEQQEMILAEKDKYLARYTTKHECNIFYKFYKNVFSMLKDEDPRDKAKKIKEPKMK